MYLVCFTGKGYNQKLILRAYLSSITCVAGEKPYKCVTCKRRFVSTGVLKAHLRTHTGVKDFKCSVCNTQFTTNGSLTRHMAMHNSVHPFKCPLCPEVFRTAINCKRHLRTHREAGKSPLVTVWQTSEKVLDLYLRLRSNRQWVRTWKNLCH